MNEKSKEELLKTGIEFYNSGAPENPYCEEFTKALSIFKNLSSENDLKEEIYNFRWHIYYLRKEFDKALNDLDSAININSENRMAFYNRGFVCLRIGKTKEALDDFHSATSLAKKTDDEDLIDAIEHHLNDIKLKNEEIEEWFKKNYPIHS
tara:strand:- start:8117 stop:8569 length:453 start_codon:yes stop_codon:yes gene_type:complete